MLKIIIILLLSTAAVIGYANTEKVAEELVQSKHQENINYKQLMELLDKGYSLIQEGIIRENHSMVAVGTDLVMFHPAPNHKPWEIFAKEDQIAYQNALIAYDKILHTHAESAINFAEEGKWLKAFESSTALGNSCINCHIAWKSKVVHY